MRNIIVSIVLLILAVTFIVSTISSHEINNQNTVEYAGVPPVKVPPVPPPDQR